MSLSKAKKQRQKLEQQGKVNPELLRGSWLGINPIMKTTPTLQQKRTQLHNKYKRNPAHDSSDSFFYVHFI
ncbi:hypothetical protein [Paenibacillus glacialis]|uniref:Uncharacterized protein n=1 Tax=Paenibacillus glacialis TaxID=494026 RepID=A0A168LCK6_9BACL|nr:hypothetical protein [Paenibacillus glacialis]OAB43194.1 hypothetical protein PGLA_09380 [Paenibacillus glacialis]